MKNLKLTSVDFSGLKGLSKLIDLTIENSENVIEEMGGPDVFCIRIDISNNAAIPINEDENLSLIEKFTTANYAGIYEGYVKKESYDGVFSISSADEDQDWNFDFHGTSLEDYSGDINEKLKDGIIGTINPKSLYKLAIEVLQYCK